MSEIAVAFAKLAGVLKATQQHLKDTDAGPRMGRAQLIFDIPSAQPYFDKTAAQIDVLAKHLPELFGDFDKLDATPRYDTAEQKAYRREQLQEVCRYIEHAFELRANSELSAPVDSRTHDRRVFISHGRAPDWREVQAYLEKDIGVATLELAQEPNEGRTVFGKLTELAGTCDYAVVVMTGDDQDTSGNARTRENVMHEIGYFQGRFGPHRVCLLHEEGVSIPSNLFGLVYVPFPKGLVSATFGILTRELRAAYR